ncbi:hypothetical protein Tco_1506944 [Tanacetum coccineum]
MISERHCHSVVLDVVIVVYSADPSEIIDGRLCKSEYRMSMLLQICHQNAVALLPQFHQDLLAAAIKSNLSAWKFGFLLSFLLSNQQLEFEDKSASLLHGLSDYTSSSARMDPILQVLADG